MLVTRVSIVLCMLLGVAVSSAATQEGETPPAVDDESLARALERDIEAHPGIRRGGVRVSIERLQGPYLTLAVTGGRPQLAHWLSRSRAELDAVVKKPQTTSAFKQQVEAALRLADALETRQGVQVYWSELSEQQDQCPVCTLLLQRRSQWRFSYPELSTQSFEKLLSEKQIALAGVAQEGRGFHVLTLAPGDHIWPVVHQFEQDKQRLWLSIAPGQRSYRQTRDLLRAHNASVRENTVLYHVYPVPLVRDLLKKEQEYAQSLRRNPTEITWGFQEVWQSSQRSWRIYAAQVVDR